ncbi:MAG: alpha-galactosidase [Treponemataceae bacterium]|nr:MAG: alpha-galactosidase [Treponemataceae bacterium]
MGIEFRHAEKLFHITGEQSAVSCTPVSYVIKIFDSGDSGSGAVGCIYWGAAVGNDSLSAIPVIEASSGGSSAEYPAHGAGDFRTPAIGVQFPDGLSVLNLCYKSHTIQNGKNVDAAFAMPHLHMKNGKNGKNAATLTIELEDVLTDEAGNRTGVSGVTVLLNYTIFEDTGAIARSCAIRNDSAQELTLTRALSASVALPYLREGYDALHLSGSWAREHIAERTAIGNGCFSIGSMRGMSGHGENPFLALLSKNATEETGEVYGFNLVYSGNFIASAESEPYSSVRVSMGINPQNFSWELKPGQSFFTPECVLVFSDAGLGKTSRTFHKTYREHLFTGEWADAAKERPVLVNNWEATYFNFNEEKLLAIASEAAALGLDLFVLDDGWFGKRDSDNSSLGDWVEDRKKLPEGLISLAQKINKKGILFGLWFEPEMISPDSELYRAHPDWCLHAKDRKRTEFRNQLVLDFSRPEIVDAIYAQMEKILSEVPIAYVKWDMNRALTEVFSDSLDAHRQGEVYHRYMLGLYSLMERLTGKFPKVLFEGCASGGGRFDPGILYYMPQFWTSDNTDAICRLAIQHGTGIVYPLSSMGAHVSAVPNHQVGRNTSIETRGNVAMAGTFGYELDLCALENADKEAIKEQVKFFKKYRALISQGDLYRLTENIGYSQTAQNEYAWIVVSENKARAFVSYTRVLAIANNPPLVLRLTGLDKTAIYHITGAGSLFQKPAEYVHNWSGVNSSFDASGSVLMGAGLKLPFISRDFQSCNWILEKVK